MVDVTRPLNHAGPAPADDIDRRDLDWYIDKVVQVLVFIGGISAIVFIIGIFVFVTKEGAGFLLDTFDFAEFQSTVFENEKLRIIGNLPYNISTAVLFHLIRHRGVIQDLHFMLQKEVVERIDAKAGSHDYGRLSVMMQLYFRIYPLFTVAPECFRPAPRVDSAVVRLTPVEDVPITPEEHDDFAALIKQAFSQRRKTLKNTLRGFYDTDQLHAAGIDPGRRPQELSIDEYVSLFRQARNQQA